MGLQNWSTTPANNANAAPNINMATGSAPSTVHPSVRQMMADVAAWYAAPEWVLQADVPTYVNATNFTVSTNRTATYSVGRRVQASGTGYTINGTIIASVYGTVTTVTVAWGSGLLDSTVSSVAVGILQNQLAALPSLANLANTTDMSQGVALVGGAARVVASIAALRLLPKTGSPEVFVTGYYSQGDSGGGAYWYDSTDTTTADNGVTVIVASDGGRWKLNFNGFLDARQAGVKADNSTDNAPLIQAAINALAAFGGGTILFPPGGIIVNTTIVLEPNVNLYGAGMSLTYIYYHGALNTPCIQILGQTSTLLSRGGSVERMSLVNSGTANTQIGIDITSGQQWSIRKVEFANFLHGLYFNQYATAHPGSYLAQAYFNDVEQNSFAQCTDGIIFSGAANRNNFKLNTYTNCQVAYNFSNSGNVSETNTFVNENIEGCHSWAEWASSFADIYSQTWVGVTIENPVSNGYVCNVKDPGRQNFFALALIPAGNSAAVDFYAVNVDSNGKQLHSDLFGSMGSSGAYVGYSNRMTEDLDMTVGAIRTRIAGSLAVNQTIAPGATISVTIPTPGMQIGDTVSFGLLVNLATLIICPAAESNNVVVTMFNPTTAAVVVNTTLYASVGSRQSYL